MRKKLFFSLILVVLVFLVSSLSVAADPVIGVCPYNCECYDSSSCQKADSTTNYLCQNTAGDPCEVGNECIANECVETGSGGSGGGGGGAVGDCTTVGDLIIVDNAGNTIQNPNCPGKDCCPWTGSGSYCNEVSLDTLCNEAASENKNLQNCQEYFTESSTECGGDNQASPFVFDCGDKFAYYKAHFCYERDCNNVNYQVSGDGHEITFSGSCGSSHAKYNWWCCDKSSIFTVPPDTGDISLLRLYEHNREVKINFSIRNTEPNPAKVSVGLDCLDFDCVPITTNNNVIIPTGGKYDFIYSLNLTSSLSDSPFAYVNIPNFLNENFEFTATIYDDEGNVVNTKSIFVKFVDQDYSQEFCEDPDGPKTGILDGSLGELNPGAWAIPAGESADSLGGNRHMACCGDDVEIDTWGDPFDQDTVGAKSCYNGSFLGNCQQPTGNKRVINENGTLYMCNGQTDTETGQTLIRADRCELVCQDNLYPLFCSYKDNEWRLVEDGYGGFASTWIDTSVDYDTECCEETRCWNTSECKEDATNIPTGREINYQNKVYRCMAGNWQEATMLFTPDGGTGGYCPEANQCFVDPLGNPICIDDTLFINGTDYHCDAGVWTSRTKQIAIHLLTIPQAGEDYVLFCGDYEDSLVFVDYIVYNNLLARNIISSASNNYCVLVYGTSKDVVFGVSLNEKIDDDDYDFSKIVDLDLSTLQDDTYFWKKTPDGKVWYREQWNLVIYDKNGNDVNPNTNFAARETELKTQLSEIATTIGQQISSPFDDSFSDLKKFNSLYINKKSNKYIFSTYEEKDDYKNALVKYQGFSTDICSFTDIYNTLYGDTSSGILCAKVGSNDYYVLSQGQSFTAVDPEMIWPDLTAKLRIS